MATITIEAARRRLGVCAPTDDERDCCAFIEPQRYCDAARNFLVERDDLAPIGAAILDGAFSRLTFDIWFEMWL